MRPSMCSLWSNATVAAELDEPTEFSVRSDVTEWRERRDDLSLPASKASAASAASKASAAATPSDRASANPSTNSSSSPSVDSDQADETDASTCASPSSISDKRASRYVPGYPRCVSRYVSGYSPYESSKVAGVFAWRVHGPSLASCCCCPSASTRPAVTSALKSV
eukprot:2266458-Pleurochrysis_carterae.AAC.1